MSESPALKMIRLLRELGADVAYHDPHVPEALPLERVRWIVSTVRDLDTNMALVQALRQHRYQGKIAVTALSDDEHHRLLEAGAEKVLRPFRDAAVDAVTALERDRHAGGGSPRD